MCPKARSVFHRGVAMRFEFFYKAFVGDDADLLDPIHSLPDIDVDVAARVINEDEGVLNNHLVWDVFEVDPHVMEVGHWVVEVVVYDVCRQVSRLICGRLI